jgi:ribosomal RNA-processing protein 36
LPSSRRRKGKVSKGNLDSDSNEPPEELPIGKRPVPIYREIIKVPKRPVRDPRFNPWQAPRTIADEIRQRKDYAFLDDIQQSEINELKAQMKKTKDMDAKAELRRQLMSLESKKKAREKRDEELDLLQEHKESEKELVSRGKKPFYLKKSEQKKLVLETQFASMSKKQVDRLIARREKKKASKERKELDSLQRVRSRD